MRLTSPHVQVLAAAVAPERRAGGAGGALRLALRVSHLVPPGAAACARFALRLSVEPVSMRASGGGGGHEAGAGDAPAPRAEPDAAAAARRGGCGAHGGDADVKPKLREDLGSTLVRRPAPRPTALEREL